jgi:DNA polymerase III delta' subunit
MSFREIIGQERAIAVLQNAIRGDGVAHAYLFAGPEGVGKRRVALEFAKAMNCLDAASQAAADSCGRCDSCRRIDHGTHPDVREVTLYGRKRLSIGIGHIREPRPPEASPDDRPPFRLERDALLRPQRARRKVYLIDPADRMTTEAQNALLRLLEEPPERVVLVLITAQPAALLPTVLSRCQPLSFLPAGVAAVERYLIERGESPDAAAVAARLAGGSVGEATRLTSPAAAEARGRVLAILARLDPGGRGDQRQAALQVADLLKAAALDWSLATGPEEADAQPDEQPADATRRGSEAEYRAALPAVLEIAASWYRDLLAVGAAGQDLAINVALASRRIERDASVDLTLASMVLALAGDESGGAVWQADGAPPAP